MVTRIVVVLAALGVASCYSRAPLPGAKGARCETDNACRWPYVCGADRVCVLAGPSADAAVDLREIPDAPTEPPDAAPMDGVDAPKECEDDEMCLPGFCGVRTCTNQHLIIAHTPVAPVVDGLLDPAWDLAGRAERIDQQLKIVTPSTESPPSFLALWDERALYFFVDVPDAHRVQDSSSPGSYNDDTVEIWLDVDASRGRSLDGKNDHHLAFSYGGGTEPRQFTRLIKTPDGGVPLFTQAVVDTDTGWRVEIAIGWEDLKQVPTAGHVLGLEIHVDDDDDGGNRDRKWAWFYGAEDLSSVRPYSWGRAQLGAPPSPPAAPMGQTAVP